MWEKVSLDLLFGGGMLTIGDRSTTMLLHRGYDVRDPSVELMGGGGRRRI